MNSVLPAAHHPDCYPSEPARALAYFRTVLGAGTTSTAPLAGNLAGIVAPHIDFRVDRQVYATAFRPLLDVPLAETYVILGVGHRSHREWNLDLRDYETPLGRATCAIDLVEKLSHRDGRFFEAEAHEGEHSIEFALVWLQAIHRLHRDAAKAAPFRFVPLLCDGMHRYLAGVAEWDDLRDFHRLSRGLSELLKQDAGAGKLRVIVSIDGCHVGPRFEHPFRVTPAFLAETARWEERLWEVVEQGDVRLFLDWMRAEGNERYFDGVGALALLLAAGEGNFKITRTGYEQWFTRRDASAVTFSSGVISSR